MIKDFFCFYNYLSRLLYTYWTAGNLQRNFFFLHADLSRLHLQIHISLLSNSSGCAHGLTFDDSRRLPFVPRGNSTLVTWRESDLEKGHDKARRRNLKRDGINCPRTETRAFLLWQNVNRSCNLIVTRRPKLWEIAKTVWLRFECYFSQQANKENNKLTTTPITFLYN